MGSESNFNTLADFRSQRDLSAPACKRLDLLFDENTFMELGVFAGSKDRASGVVTGYGYVEGNLVYAYAQDITADGGAVGAVHAAKIKKVYEMAAKTGAPVVGIFDSNGARMDEGHDAMAGYGDLLACANHVSGVVPQIALVLGTCAGAAAMIAASADIVIAAEKAEFFLTAPFITQAKGEKVEGAGSAKNAALSGAVQILEADEEKAIERAHQLIAMLPANNLSPVPINEFAASETIPVPGMKAADLIASIADAGSVVALQPDFGKAAVTAFAAIGGSTAGVVATEGGRLDADTCAKIARFVRTCDAFNLPVVTLVDTEGFVESSAAELAGSVRDAAKLAHAYAEATCPKISIVTGQAYGPAYIVLAGKNANADVTVAWEQAVISPLAPVTAVEVLWRERMVGTQDVAATREALVTEYKQTLASPFAAAGGGYVDTIILPEETRGTIISLLEALEGKRVSKMPKKHGNMPF